MKLSSNKGILMQDLAIAIVAIMTCASLVGAIYIEIAIVQSETKIDTQVAIYAMQILENIEKISYSEVQNGMEDHYRQLYEIPEGFDLKLQVIDYQPEQDSQDIIKDIVLTIDYTFQGRKRSTVFENIKVKES